MLSTIKTNIQRIKEFKWDGEELSTKGQNIIILEFFSKWDIQPDYIYILISDNFLWQDWTTILVEEGTLLVMDFWPNSPPKGAADKWMMVYYIGNTWPIGEQLLKSPNSAVGSDMTFRQIWVYL